jgi:regulator of replication initiation timing
MVNTALQARVQHMAAEIGELRAMNEALAAANAAMSAEHAQLRDQLAELQRQMAEAEDDNDRLHRVINERAAVIDLQARRICCAISFVIIQDTISMSAESSKSGNIGANFKI